MRRLAGASPLAALPCSEPSPPGGRRTLCRSPSSSPARKSGPRSTASPSVARPSPGWTMYALTRGSAYSSSTGTRTGPPCGGRVRTAQPASSSATPRWRGLRTCSERNTGSTTPSPLPDRSSPYSSPPGGGGRPSHDASGRFGGVDGGERCPPGGPEVTHPGKYRRTPLRGATAPPTSSLPGRQGDLGPRPALIRDDRPQVRHAVDPRRPLVIGLHNVPRASRRIGIDEHFILRSGVVHLPPTGLQIHRGELPLLKTGFSTRAWKRRSCSASDTENQYFTRRMPSRRACSQE